MKCERLLSDSKLAFLYISDLNGLTNAEHIRAEEEMAGSRGSQLQAIFAKHCLPRPSSAGADILGRIRGTCGIRRGTRGGRSSVAPAHGGRTREDAHVVLVI